MIKKTLGGKMRELTAEQIQQNYDSLINTIQLHITGDRKEKVLKMYDDMKDRFMMAPASAKEHYHNAMLGGYVDHILRVVDFSLKVKELWEQSNCKIDFTDEELVFSALHHDLGKVGDLENDYYIPQDNEWRRKNMGEIFTHNPKCEYMSVTDRAFYLLQYYNIPISKKEFIGIRLTDGMYEEANKSYLVAYKSEFQLRSTIQYILHQADMMAAQIEGRLTKQSIEKEETETFEKIKNIKEVLGSEDKPSELQDKPGKISNDLFDELFGDKK
tara:strand:- start:477 stop:1292 length:816 start_codon:yes stop_codon:yes gene_type:complete